MCSSDLEGVLLPRRPAARVAHPAPQVDDLLAPDEGGARRAAAARSDAGVAIARDVEVVVLRYERGIAYVRPWSELEDPPAI